MVFLAKVGSIEQNIGCLLEGGKHESRVLHLSNTVSSDTVDLSLSSHNVREDVDMSDVDFNRVVTDRVLYLLYNLIPRSLNPEHLVHLNNMVCDCLGVVHLRNQKYLVKAKSFRENPKLVS